MTEMTANLPPAVAHVRWRRGTAYSYAGICPDPTDDARWLVVTAQGMPMQRLTDAQLARWLGDADVEVAS